MLPSDSDLGQTALGWCSKYLSFSIYLYCFSFCLKSFAEIIKVINTSPNYSNFYVLTIFLTFTIWYVIRTVRDRKTFKNNKEMNIKDVLSMKLLLAVIGYLLFNFCNLTLPN